MARERKATALLGEIARSYDKYADLYKLVTERYRNQLVDADPSLPRDQAFHLAHNWGNDASRQVLDCYHRVADYVSGRKTREHRRLYGLLKTEINK